MSTRPNKGDECVTSAGAQHSDDSDWVKKKNFLIVTYTIIQNITSSEICYLYF